MMPRDHFSWSQLDCYTRDPGEYFNRYVMGFEMPPTLPMRLGSIVHEAIAGTLSEKGWREALVELGFTPDYQSGLARALETIEKPQQPELEMRLPFEGFASANGPVDLLAYLDNLNGEEIVEYKTGSAWNQTRVDAHGQLTLYAMLYRMKFGKMPKKITLIHIDVARGRVTKFQTKRLVKDVEDFRKRLLVPTMTLIDRGVFHKV